jgi:ribonuclease P protein component
VRNFRIDCCRFLKKQRLLSASDFERVLKGGRRVSAQELRANWLENFKDVSRMGVVVSKKTGKANRRHRLKRFCREWFRRHCREFAKNIDLVFFPQSALANLSFMEREKQFNEIFGHINRQAA